MYQFEVSLQFGKFFGRYTNGWSKSTKHERPIIDQNADTEDNQMMTRSKQLIE